MTVSKQAARLLAPKGLDLPSAPRVLGIEVEDTVDSSGEDALRVYVIIADGTRDKELTGENMLKLKGAIHDKLLAHGIHLFPYVFLRTESQRRDELAQQQG